MEALVVCPLFAAARGTQGNLHKICVCFRVITALFLVATAMYSPAQEGGTPDADAWRQIPVPSVRSHDTVPSQVRQTRDSIWEDSVLKHGTLSNGIGRAIDGDLNELSPRGNAAWVVATFKDYAVFTTQHAVYTDIHMSVDRVIYNTTPHTLAPGDLFDIELAGGTVLLPNGTPLPYGQKHTTYSLQPSKTYLMLLGNSSASDTFFEIERWVVRDGVLAVDTSDGAARARHRSSRITGLTMSAAEALLKRSLTF